MISGGNVQFGKGDFSGERGRVSRVTGEWVTGPETLSDEELAKNRVDLGKIGREHRFDDDYHRDRSAKWENVVVPFLSAANWGGQGLHLRGNIEGFVRAASRMKWLEVHGREHWTEFYTNYGIAIQKRFLDYFLKGFNNDWKEQSRIQLQVRRVDGFVTRGENEWPLARTRWTRFYLHPADTSLQTAPAAAEGRIAYDPLGDGVTFRTAPLAEEIEITMPVAAKLFLSSATTDADLFLVLRVFDPQGKEIVFPGALDPHTPIGQGWLRASHRKLDPALSTEYRPYHPHDGEEPLEPGRIYPVDVEIWPTCIVVPAGYQIALTVRGKDYEYEGEGSRLGTVANVMRGCGPFLHNDPEDRPPTIYGGKVTLYGGGERGAYLLLPVIPKVQDVRPEGTGDETITLTKRRII